jgi:hypothetical protein
MPRLVATESYSYGIPQRPLKPGDEFDASETDAQILKMAGKAQDAPIKSQNAPRTKTRALKAGSDSPSSDKDGESDLLQEGGGRYRRSDMRAED